MDFSGARRRDTSLDFLVCVCVYLRVWWVVGNSRRTGWPTLSLGWWIVCPATFFPPTYERRDQVASPSVNLNALLERNTLSPRYDPPSPAGIDPYFFLLRCRRSAAVFQSILLFIYGCPFVKGRYAYLSSITFAHEVPSAIVLYVHSAGTIDIPDDL